MLRELSINKMKWIRTLHAKKGRENEGLYLLEGEKMVLEAIKLIPDQIHTLLFLEKYKNPGSHLSCEQYWCTEKQLNQISTLKTPNKLVAVLKMTDSQKANLKGLVLALDGIQDPGNLGTIMRIADWFGIQEIICSHDTVDCYNPKVVQASMGAILRVQVSYHNLDTIFKSYSGRIYGAYLDGNSIYQESLSEEGIILLGNEGKGIRKENESFVTDRIHIPSFGAAESLNVSVAAGIITSEFRRRSF